MSDDEGKEKGTEKGTEDGMEEGNSAQPPTTELS